jgi:hypothetical protein
MASRFASERDYWYTIIVVDHVGRQIGEEALETKMNRQSAYKRLLACLDSTPVTTDSLIYGGHLIRDARNDPY